MWDMTVRSSQRLDRRIQSVQGCLRHILQVPFAARVTNQEVCLRSAQPPVTQTVECSGVSHIVRSDSDEDHTRALNAGIDDLPKEWRRPRMVALVKHGYAPSRMTSNNKTWGCGRPGTELMTVINGVKSGAQKMLDVKMTVVKVTDQMTGHETAGHEIAGHKRSRYETGSEAANV